MTARNGNAVLLYGLVKQGVLPLHDPILGATEPLYAKAIEKSKINGVFPNAGLTGELIWTVINPIYSYGPVAGTVFRRAILTDPLLYCQGAARNLMLFLGIRGSEYDNALTRQIVFTSKASQIDPGPPWIAPLGDEFKRTTAPSVMSAALQEITPLYEWTERAGLIVTVGMFFVGLWRLDRFILAFTAPALSFVAMQCLILVSQDRMIVPVQPILLLNLILLPRCLGFKINWPRIEQILKVVPVVRTDKPVLATNAQGALSKRGSLIWGIVIGLMAGLLIGFSVAILQQGHGTLTPTMKELGVRSPTAIDADLYGYISTVNGAAPVESGDGEHPVPVPVGRDAVLEGWFAYGASMAAISMDEVFGVVDGELVKAVMVKRPDVSKASQNPKLANSGYRLTIEKELLEGGPKRIDMIGRVKQGGKLHRFPQPIYLVVR